MSRSHYVRSRKGYNIDLVAKSALGGRFYSTFTIRRGEPGQLVHMEDRDAGVIRDSEQDAINDAERRAYAWIDAQPD